MAIKYRPIPNATESDLVLTSLQDFESGFYKCVLSNDSTLVTTTAAELSILNSDEYAYVFVTTFDELFDVAGISGSKTIIAAPGTYTLTADITIPSNKVLYVLTGANIVTTGFTFLCNGDFHADKYAIFSGTGTVNFGKSITIFPEWFGAKGDASATLFTGTDDTTAFTNAVSSLIAGGIIEVSKLHAIEGTSAGDFFNGVTIPAAITDITIQGVNKVTSGFVQIGSLPGNTFRGEPHDVGDGLWSENIKFDNLYFNTDSTLYNIGSGSPSPLFFYRFHNIEVSNCIFEGFGLIGGFHGANGLGATEISTNLKFHDNYINGSGVVAFTGITVFNIDGFWVENNHFNKISKPIELESHNPASGTLFTNGLIRGNKITNGTVATYSATNSFIAIGAQVTAGNECCNIIVSDNIIDLCASGTCVNVSGAFLFIGAATDIGNIHDITISNNQVHNYTPTSADYGCYLVYCDAVQVINNVFSNPLASTGSPYAIALLDTTNSLIALNNIQGSNWGSGITETANIELNNVYLSNQNSDTGTAIATISTSKSTVIDINGLSDRVEIKIGNGAGITFFKLGATYLNAVGVTQAIVDSTGLNIERAATFASLNAEPSDKKAGMVVRADRATWDPLSKGSGTSYLTWYNGTAWKGLHEQ
ncbi:hypothetical protein M0R04_09500 [Candidatus Dojkabacteria bacterium]|jgi:hypothetical protein|nr:hypothetical protein [Candidatus Dojkabacteria bacterium]